MKSTVIEARETMMSQNLDLREAEELEKYCEIRDPVIARLRVDLMAITLKLKKMVNSIEVSWKICQRLADKMESDDIRDLVIYRESNKKNYNLASKRFEDLSIGYTVAKKIENSLEVAIESIQTTREVRLKNV